MILISDKVEFRKKLDRTKKDTIILKAKIHNEDIWVRNVGASTGLSTLNDILSLSPINSNRIYKMYLLNIYWTLHLDSRESTYYLHKCWPFIIPQRFPQNRKSMIFFNHNTIEWEMNKTFFKSPTWRKIFYEPVLGAKEKHKPKFQSF